MILYLNRKSLLHSEILAEYKTDMHCDYRSLVKRILHIYSVFVTTRNVRLLSDSHGITLLCPKIL